MRVGSLLVCMIYFLYYAHFDSKLSIYFFPFCCWVGVFWLIGGVSFTSSLLLCCGLILKMLEICFCVMMLIVIAPLKIRNARFVSATTYIFIVVNGALEVGNIVIEPLKLSEEHIFLWNLDLLISEQWLLTAAANLLGSTILLSFITSLALSGLLGGPELG